MLIRYLPGKLDERIPVPVQKKVVLRESERGDGGILVFETGDGKKEEVRLDRCTPLTPGGKGIRTWLKMGGLFILLMAFCAGGYGIALKMYVEGIAGMNVPAMLQLVVSGGLVVYVSRAFKAAVERHLYGGLSFDRGDIYFQSEDEKAMFGDIVKKGKRR